MKAGILSLIKSYVARQLPVGQLSGGGSSGATILGYDRSARYGIQHLAQSYRTSPILRDVVGKIAFSVATARWRLYKTNSKNSNKSIKGMLTRTVDYGQRTSILKSLVSDGKLSEVESHPFFRFFENANPYMTGLNARKVTQLYLELPGETFWVLKYGKDGYPSEYWPIPPHWVKEVPNRLLSIDEIRSMRRDGSYRNNVDTCYQININSVPHLFAQDEVIWMRDIDLDNPYGRGSGIGYTLGDEIETDEYASKFLKSFFINSGRPELIITAEEADESGIRRAEAKFDSKFGRYWNGAKVFWSNAKISVQELTSKIVDMDIVNLRKAERDTIGTTYGVPPELRAIVENANRATIDSSFYLYNKVTIVPRLEFTRAELNKNVLPLFDDNLYADYDSPVPEDKEHELKVMSAAPYAVTRGEWRQRSGLPVHEGMDDVYLQDSKLSVYSVDGKLISSGTAVKEEPAKGIVSKAGTVGISPLDEEAVNALVNSIEEGLLVEYTIDYHKGKLSEWGQARLDELGAQGMRFDLQNPVVQAFLKEYSSNHIKDINETTKRDVAAALMAGVQRGESIEQLKKRVIGAMGQIPAYRARRIARTEVVAASNFGSLHSYKESGVVEKKKWLAIVDTVARTTHIKTGTKKPIPLNEAWDIDGDKGMYPGGFSRPVNNCNCRCTMLPVTIEIPVREVEDNFIIKYLAFTDDWEDGLMRRFIRAAEQQERDLLKKLGSY